MSDEARREAARLLARSRPRVTVTCDWCGARFEALSGPWERRYCSASHKEMGWRRGKRERNARNE